MADGKSIFEESANLRAQLKSDARLNLEFKSAISRLLRDHKIDVSTQLLSELSIAVPAEISTGAAIVLPEPDLPL